MIKNASFSFVIYLGNTFSGVQCPAVILGLKNARRGQIKGCRVEPEKKKFVIKENRDNDELLFSFHMDDEEYACLCKIASVENAVYLKNNAMFSLGIVTGNNKEYVRKEKREGWEQVLRGSNIYRYRIGNTDDYIRFVPEKFQQTAPEAVYRAKEKLLYRFIAGVPVFAYDDRQTLSLNSCNILIPKIEGMDIRYVLAVLNSRVAAYFIGKKYNSVKVLRSHIEALPIPTVSKERQSTITEKVSCIINEKGNIKELYEEIDEEIMNIYALPKKMRNTVCTALAEKNMFLPEK